MIKEVINGNPDEDHSWVGFENGFIIFGAQFRDVQETPSRLKTRIFFSEPLEDLGIAINKLYSKLQNT